MIKFGRSYILKCTIPIVKEDGSIDTTNAEEVVIEYPLKLEFEISRNTFSSSNSATLRIYNLAESTRSKLFQDSFNIWRFVFVDLYAGYVGDQPNATNLPLVLSGKMVSCYSEGKGTDVVTTITVMDNDIIQSYTNKTFAAGTTKNEVVVNLIQEMDGLKVGAITPIEGVLERPLTVSDPTFIAIRDLTGGAVFVDNGTVNVLHQNEVIGDVGIYKLDSDAGLLGTPRRRDAQVEIDCIFAPEITVGQLVEVSSVKDPTHFNGQYKVCGIKHSGVISGAESGQAITTLSLFVGNLLPNSNFVFTQISSEPKVQQIIGNKRKDLVIDAQATTIRDVYNYIQKNKKAPHTKITENIYWDEVVCRVSQQGIPSLQVLANLYTVATYVQAFRNKFYPSSRIQINSGWRSESYNASIGGAAKSQHITGKALDIVIKNQVNRKVWDNITQFWKYGYIQYYPSFIHVDIRNIGVGIANDK